MPANEETPTTSFLLRLLKDEIARDGGACLATTLKDYVIDSKEPLEVQGNGRRCNKSKKRRNQQLNSLLVNSNVGKPKLLAFLESHPDVFCVARNVIPHWVLLVNAVEPPSNAAQVFPHRETFRTKVFQKALYVLRKRQARIERRKTKSQDAASEDKGVFTHWLLRQCCWELHFLLRHCDFYRNPELSGYTKPSDVKQVGSREWEGVVLPVFEGLLRAARETTKSCNENGTVQVTISRIKVEDGKAWLYQSDSEEEHNEQQLDADDAKFDYIVRPAEGSEEPNRCEEKTEDEDVTLNLVRRIDQTLTDIVCRKDGGHQVSLSLILHRYPQFKELLGGRDLWSLYNEFSKDEDASFFSSISMFQNGTNLILRSKRSKTIDGNDSNNNKDSLREKRMMVDEEGLYSVTNNKWGRAMSNLVIQACRQKNLFGDSKVVNDEQEGVMEDHKSQSTIKTVIDLTASVGGMTLGLAKSNFFDRVIALEIDQGRAALCRENLSRHGFHDSATNNINKSTVEVLHQDSVEQIPCLPRGACFVIDPPWGGYDYKEKVRRQQAEGRGQVLKLGDTSLEDVLGLMSRHNAPCVVGLRLPTNFAAIDFLDTLRETKNIEFECLTRRKISVQLFVVLYFPPSTECI